MELRERLLEVKSKTLYGNVASMLSVFMFISQHLFRFSCHVTFVEDFELFLKMGKVGNERIFRSTLTLAL